MRKIVLVAAALSALAAGQAAAHARLIQATPKVGATVAVAPKALKLTYSESIVAAESGVTVAGPGGRAVVTGALAVDPKNKRLVTVPFANTPTPGDYKVSWHMKTEDGHKTDGDFAFTIKP